MKLNRYNFFRELLCIVEYYLGQGFNFKEYDK
jgi:hypothetical protein